MARKLRVQYPGALYHVMNHWDRGEPILRVDIVEQPALLGTLAGPMKGRSNVITLGTDPFTAFARQSKAYDSLSHLLHRRVLRQYALDPSAECQWAHRQIHSGESGVEQGHRRLRAHLDRVGSNRESPFQIARFVRWFNQIDCPSQARFCPRCNHANDRIAVSELQRFLIGGLFEQLGTIGILRRLLMLAFLLGNHERLDHGSAGASPYRS